MWSPASVSPLVRQVHLGDAIGLGGVRESCRACLVGLLPWRGLSCLKAWAGGLLVGTGVGGGFSWNQLPWSWGVGGVRQVLAGLGAGVVGPDLSARVTHREAKPPLTLRLSL